jgi:diguanylate cyclase (GGDEF)-like protein
MLRQNLLVIDDAPDTHELVGVWLVDEPIELHSAFDGAGGLEAARRLVPDLILLDVDMPGTNGFDVCAQLKADEATRDIPVVFLTGASDSEQKLRGLELGAVDYVLKPFEPAELRARVRGALRTKHLLDLLAQRALLEEDRAHVLEMVTQNRPLEDVVAHLVQSAHRICPGAAAECIVLFDGKLHHDTVDLSPEFRQELDKHLYSFTAEFCSRSVDRAAAAAAATPAAGSSNDVIISDIEIDPVWSAVRKSARAHGLRTCWASLIRSGRDDVLGMFCLYPRISPELSADATAPSAAVPDEMIRSYLNIAGKLIAMAVEHYQLTQHLAHRAQHDALTGLPNRVLFEDRLQQTMLRASMSNKSVVIAFIDVDRFKNINDTLGHHAGDVMLCQLVARISESLGSADTLARMGGDEFALILPHLQDIAAAEAFGNLIIESFRAPLDVLGQELFVTISLGLAMYPTDGRDSITLKKNADAALYAAKNGGRDRVRCFDAGMNNGARQRLELENSLRRAAENGELRLHYQPKVDPDDRIVGLEALIRWQHPRLGLVPPAQFIPLAEETGLIAGIGRWVLNEAARQSRAWTAAGLPQLPIAVNVSALQFGQPDFEAVLADVLKAHALPPHLLELEITESLLMQNIHDARRKLERLKQLGTTIAIDDFGTGYSSLSYLQRLPIDLLKVDHTFVSVIGTGELAGNGNPKVRDDATIVRSIAALAQSLGLGLIAEGVETEAQRSLLLSISCRVMQGFFFSAARPAEQITEMLRLPCIPRRNATTTAAA